MDSHLSSKDNENMWTNMSPTVKSRGRELGVRVSVGTAHNCCPSPSEAEAGRGSGAHNELETSLDYMRLCLRGKGVLSSLLLRGAALGPLWSSPRERENSKFQVRVTVYRQYFSALASFLQPANTLTH